MEVKEIDKLEREVVENLSGNSSVIVLDTGALIDVARATRKYDLVHRISKGNGERNPNYFDPVSLLNYFSGIATLVITPSTNREIYRHARTRLNGHTFELPVRTAEFALDNMVASAFFVADLQGKLPKDEARYDAYWAAKEGCNGNVKKHSEGCSETDREILETAAYLSSDRTISHTGEKIDRVVVLSSDAHVLSGAKLLKSGFDGKYRNLIPISTRC